MWDAEISMYYCNARMYDPVLGRFTSRDPVFGKLTEPMTLHTYLYCLYCLNDPLNKVDPSGQLGGFFASLYTRGKKAASSAYAYLKAKKTLHLGATLWNAGIRGTMNMWFGPDDVSSGNKFFVGFITGIVEMQVGLRVNFAAGGSIGGFMQSTLNQAYSENRLLSRDAIEQIIFDTVIGFYTGAGAMLGNAKGKEAIVMALVGIDRDIIAYK
jgi:RHS repeat-associated protein